MARQEKVACVEFTLWVKGEKTKASTHVGTMVTIGWGRQVFGLSPTISTSDPRRLSVALVTLKSHQEPISKGKRLSTLEVVSGKRMSFEPSAPIKFKAAITGMSAKTKKRCCVTCNDWTQCASCTVEHSCGSCCSTDECCKSIGK